MAMKTCTRCDCTFEPIFFNQPYCLDCRREYHNDYYQRNRERMNERAREKYQERKAARLQKRSATWAVVVGVAPHVGDPDERDELRVAHEGAVYDVLHGHLVEVER